MISGIYIASRGMTPLLQKQDIIANNLSNLNTTGFKQSGLFIKSYQKFLENDLRQPFVNSDINVDEVYTDYSEGPMKKTDSPLDFYIKGSGFFTIMTPDGIQYTRNGNFSLNNEGFLVTSDGCKVMGKDGYIRLNPEYKFTITEAGEILQENSTIDALKIVDFEKPYRLMRCGDCRFKPLDPEEKEIISTAYVIKQGYLEGSNVNLIQNMVRMISSYRNFEADQKALLAQDQTLERAVNQVGKVS
ncbi:MAG: flagellar basal-body rod protein FlgF [Chitinispirillaceae bacterium]|nr:flagellar basal-body rod protein FlgF [Chitinispirillaceae bacterium]